MAVNQALSLIQEHQGCAYAWNVSAMNLKSAMISSRVLVPCSVHNVVARDFLECRQLFGFRWRGCDPGFGFCDILAGASDVSFWNKFKKRVAIA
jgi:hypothetical protein